MINDSRGRLEDFKTPPNVRLALLWASVMFLYIYNDYFSLYTPGTVEAMAKGNLGPIGRATDIVLLGLAAMLAVPSLMIFLSVGLAPWISRWLNVAIGLVHTAIELLTLPGSPLFFKLLAVAEVTLTSLIVFYALRWPRRA